MLSLITAELDLRLSFGQRCLEVVLSLITAEQMRIKTKRINRLEVVLSVITSISVLCSRVV